MLYALGCCSQQRPVTELTLSVRADLVHVHNDVLVPVWSTLFVSLAESVAELCTDQNRSTIARVQVGMLYAPCMTVPSESQPGPKLNPWDFELLSSPTYDQQPSLKEVMKTAGLSLHSADPPEVSA